jgi:hypothetical protein
MTYRKPTRQPPATFRIQISAHDVERWAIPATSVEIPAADAGHARLIAVRMAHSAAGVPPWLPCVRASLKFARAA